MPEKSTCMCQGGLRLVFPCSGAADVGAIADQAARRVSAEGAGKMFCLAGIGAGIPGIVKTTEAADQVLAIDGCPLACARTTLEKAGFTHFDHLCLTDLGLSKGESPVDEANIALVASKATDILQDVGQA